MLFLPFSYPGDGAGAKGTEFLTSDAIGASESILRAWLDWLGLRFNPFQSLDAAADTRLGEYLVEHEVLASIWGDWNSFVFAPAGGGKTALRVRTSQACWVGQATNHPFPISYLPPFLLWLHTHPSLDEHLAAISQAGAIRLLLALLYRPHWFFALDPQARRALRQSLDWNLPGPLDYWLMQAQESQSLAPLLEIFDPTFMLPDPPDASTLLHLCDALGSLASARASLPSPKECWRQLVDLLLTSLGFRSIYILIDGLDAVPETATNTETAVGCLSTLLPMIDRWSEQHIFVKGYFPEEVQSPLTTRFPVLLERSYAATIRWTPALLADVVRRRVYVASQGAFGSLDAVASPATRDIETTLAKMVIPLPREMLVLTQRVLWEHVARDGATGTILPEDIDAAVAWYRAQPPSAQISTASIAWS